MKSNEVRLTSSVHFLEPSERMLPVKLLKLPIDVRQLLAQVCRRLEKLLTGDRKKFGRAFKSIRVNRQLGPVALLFLQAIPRAREDGGPCVGAMAESRWRRR